MAVYRDIDHIVRVRGLNIPSGSATISESLTVNGVDIIDSLNSKVPTTRRISAGTGLSGGGTLSSNRSLSVDFNEVAAKTHNHSGVYLETTGGLLSGALGVNIGANTGSALSLNSDNGDIMFQLNSAENVLESSADLVLSGTSSSLTNLRLEAGTTTATGSLDVSGSIKEGGSLLSSKYTLQTITVTGGTGLSGGGSLDSNRTLSVDFAGTGTANTSARSDHHHDTDYLGISSKAVDSDKLDGNDSTYYAQASTLSSHTGDTSIHKDWGNWSTNGIRDLRVYNKRAMVGYDTGDGDKLAINYGTDFANGVEVFGGLRVDGNNVWTSGNFSTNDFVSKANDGEHVLGNFTTRGRLWVGNSGNPGSVVVKDSNNQNAIHLGGSSALSNVKAFISDSGSAKFNGAVQVGDLIMGSSSMVENLNAEFIGGSKETEFVRTPSINEIGGQGVYEGLSVRQKSPTPDMSVEVDAGKAYTDSGRRFEYPQTIMPISTSSENWDRYDIIYIRGQEGAANEGRISVYTGAAVENPTPDYSALPTGAIVLATVHVRKNVGTITDGTSGTYDAIDNSMKEYRGMNHYQGKYLEVLEPIYTRSSDGFNENGQWLTEKYAQLATPNVFLGNISIKKSGGASLTIQSNNGNSSDSYPAEIYLKEDEQYDHGVRFTYHGDSNYAAITTVSSGVGRESIRFDRNSGDMTMQKNVDIVGTLKSRKNGGTVTIPKGERQVTWTHNYGNSNYAANFTTNSFERHVRWVNKLANSITVEIDDPSDKEILVDCILIGY